MVLGWNREQDLSDPGRLAVVFLKAAPGAGRVKALQAAITGPETVRDGGREVYIYYPDGMGRSRLTNARSSKLGTRAAAELEYGRAAGRARRAVAFRDSETLSAWSSSSVPRRSSS
jgi:hypothetical protein